MLDTDQLRSFVAIVDTGSFTRAAERVNKTQSAVSMHIRRLEEQLGRPLFLKQGRGVKLSDDGEKLVDYARRMLELEAQALADISRKALAGRIRFGIPDDYAETFIPEIMSRFGRRHPLVEMSVVCEDSLTLCDRVAAREVDMAVVTVCSDVRGAEILREEPLYWVSGAASRAHETRPLPLALSGPILRLAGGGHLLAAGSRHRVAADAGLRQPRRHRPGGERRTRRDRVARERSAHGHAHPRPARRAAGPADERHRAHRGP